MTLPRTGTRVVAIDGAEYRWTVTGNDGWIDLYVELGTDARGGLQARFDYALRDRRDPETGAVSHQQVREVTPIVVRRVVEWALMNGWVPGMPATAPFVVDTDKTDLIAPLER